MPTVPTIDDLRGRIKPAAAPNVQQSLQISPGDAGAREAQSIQKAAEKVDDMGDALARTTYRMLQDQAEIAANEAFMSASEKRRALLLEDRVDDDGNEIKGILNRKGGAAIGSKDEAVKGMNKIYEEARAGLPDAVQQRFSRLWERSANADIDRAAVNEAAQLSAYKESAATGVIETVKAEAVGNYRNVDAISGALVTIEEKARDIAEAKGLAPEAVKAFILKEKSSLHSSVIGQMLADGEDLAASAYFKGVKKLGELTDRDQVVISKQVEEGSLRASSQAATDRIMEKGLDHSSALAAARDIKDPKVRDETVRRVNARFAENNAIEAENERAMKKEAWQIVEKDGVDALTPSQRAALDGFTLAAMERRDLQKKKGEPVVWGPDAAKRYAELDDISTDPNRRDEWANLDLTPDIGILPESDWKHFQNRQAQDRRGDNSESGVAMTRKEIVDSTVKNILRLDPKKDKDAEKIALFQRKVQEEVNAYMTETKRRPASKDIQEMVDRLVMTGHVSSGYRFYPDSKKRVYEVDPADADKFYVAQSVDDIPSADAQDLRDALRRKFRRDVSDEELIVYYNRWAKTGKR